MDTRPAATAAVASASPAAQSSPSYIIQGAALPEAPQAMQPPSLIQQSLSEAPANQAVILDLTLSPTASATGGAPRNGTTASDGSNPHKRRRLEIENANINADAVSMLFRGLGDSLEQKIASLGGLQSLYRADRTRFQLLMLACQRQDAVFLHLHLMLCSWSLNPDARLQIPPNAVKAVSRAFEVIQVFIYNNSDITMANLEWFAGFGPPEIAHAHSQTSVQAADFLMSLGDTNQFQPSISDRGYPYLFDELLGVYKCTSHVMQNIMFEAARQLLNYHEPFYARAQQLFEFDRHNHLDETGRTRPIPLFPADPNEIPRQNAKLIREYQNLAAQAFDMMHARPGAMTHQQQQQQQQVQWMRPAGYTRQSIQFQPIQTAHLQPANAGSSPNTVGRMAYLNVVPIQVPSQVDTSYNRNSRPPVMSPTMQHPTQFPNPAMNSNVGSPEYQQRSSQPTLNWNVYRPEYSANLSPTANVFPSMLANANHVAAVPAGRQQVRAINQTYIMPYSPQAAQQQVVSGPAMLTSDSRSYFAETQQRMRPLSPPTSATFPLPPQRGRGQPPGVPMQIPSHNIHTNATAQAAASRSRSTLLRTPPSYEARFIPPSDFNIDRSQYPHSHHELKSLFMSLHQAHVRSPPRTRRVGEVDERYYQSVQSLALAPFRLTYCHDVDFNISGDDFARTHQRPKSPSPLQPSSLTRQYWHGSLRFRIRCCRLRSDGPVEESDWVCKEVMWPQHIFIDLNGHKLSIRREAHNGKDLPAEVTDHLLAGKNRLKVIVPRAGPTAPDRRGNIFYLAIEVTETVRHSDLLNEIQTQRRQDRHVTLNKIRSRITAVPEEDGIAIVDRSGADASELSVGLTDPFSSRIYKTPARGIACAHMECFDLETWLNTRPIKQQLKCSHEDVCTCPKNMEPTEPDRWKCPICSGDARPKSLYIDGFLADVRHELQEQNKLHTRSILVDADGKWRPVDLEEEDDDEEEGSDGDGPHVRKGSVSVKKDLEPIIESASVQRRAIEVIELD
ncbi:hypothetical protein BD289DRAFT_64721 [Coniella lustricola]|uniref:SP-RING-type domain-containing protein n=1 Tax=Coniella lustricola TaxID=2025994 RepID=A0A2T3AHU2_9PEZI|nr:hypothetical protein BD289DRAFT_64721 [Coniella lustricola]